ncbi:MAG: c-type cytochrome [Trueperaceae bacterium]|nr:c-type cytochrome [Trueperaceae bacterium]
MDRIVWSFGVLAIVVGVGTAVVRAQGSAPLRERGAQLYRQLYCGMCHTLGAAQTRGSFGPEHNDIGAVAAARVADPSYHGDADDAAGYLRESITAPAAYLAPGWAMSSHAMPAYDLSEQDLDALVAFLLAQAASPGATRPPEGR